jgi:hypothetical protein
MDKPFDYVVILKRTNEKYIDRISFLLCVFAILAFVYVQLRVFRVNLIFCIAVFFILFGLVLNAIEAKRGKKVRYKNWLLIAGIFWVAMPWLQWISILYGLFSFLEYQAKYPLEIGFKNDLVLINSLFKRKFSWSDFENIILKDGLLTLDFKNNTIFQKEVLDDDEPDADEDEFNKYCREQLSRVRG